MQVFYDGRARARIRNHQKTSLCEQLDTMKRARAGGFVLLFIATKTALPTLSPTKGRLRRVGCLLAEGARRRGRILTT